MRTIIIVFLMSLLLIGCRQDEFVTLMQEETIPIAEKSEGIVGLYLLNEGNMGSNKCTLDYLELCGNDSLSHYYRNIYGQRNPQNVLELGDVGNDIAIYGTKLWIVVNCSNKVEICEAKTAKRVGQLEIANCRYIAFDEGFAYISSYAGPMDKKGHHRLGRVYKVDTLTMQKIDSLAVGYQPEEMTVANGKLYVANSGGYYAPEYDNRVTVIDLKSFKTLTNIEVSINLHHIATDHYGQIWVSSRGDYYDTSACLYWIEDDILQGKIDVPVSAMTMVGDSLYYIGSTFSYSNAITSKTLGIVDVKKHQPITTHLFDSPEIGQMTLPYGIAVNPVDHDFYLMDAKNYVTSGELLHFTAEGKFDWKVRTGDIPSRVTWLVSSNGNDSGSNSSEPSFTSQSPYIEAVDEYVPAPGQFVNTLPEWEEGDDALRMVGKATEAIAHNANGLITLGGWGGYVTFHFDHKVINSPNMRDIYIAGNAIEGGSEAGIVCVSQDANANGLPDDIWYELSGSADEDSTNVCYGYTLTYIRQGSLQNILWEDNQGGVGSVTRNAFHQQEYYPNWIASPLSFSGTRLPNNAHTSTNGSNWVLDPLRYGYADNKPNADTLSNSFDIDWAVDPVSRERVTLDYIDFVRVYTALNQSAGWLGETSTEISGAMDLNVTLRSTNGK